MSTPESVKLWDNYNRWINKIKSGKSYAGDEVAMGIAYQDLVKAGLVMQVKRKFRGR